MTEIICVRFKEGGRSYYFNPNGMTIHPGDHVIIDTSRGVEFGECVEGNRLIDEMEIVSPLRPVLRVATDADFETLKSNQEKEEKAFQICQQKIQEHELDMKLVEVEYNFDGSKIIFFFTSDGRVDFRALVRDLASVFHTRIELRQIGVRDEAKMLGGLGVCGRPYCCSSFLSDFHPVSIKMAKTQSLSLNPTKISGACGRLMCCLKYEQEAYEDVLKRTPKLESLVETPDGVGTVNSVQLLREKVKVRLDNDPDNPQIYSSSEIKVIRSGKGKRPEGYELAEQPERPVQKQKPQAEETEETVTPAAQEQKRAPRTMRREESRVKRTRAAEPTTDSSVSEERAGETEARRSQHRPRRYPNNGSHKQSSQPPQTKAEGSGQAPSSKGEKSQNKRPHHQQHHRGKKPNGKNSPKAENGAPKSGE